jgi:hypothetical protein
MTPRRLLLTAAALSVLILAAVSFTPEVPVVRVAATATLPTALTDQDFWRLSTNLSEAGGTFHSDNFVSNEGRFQTVIPDLVRRAKQGGLYIGVGPEQNFTYMAALRPRMAFIVDIRRGNLHEHLLYKALFELSADRAEFLARLFSRAKPTGPSSNIADLFATLGRARPTEALYRANLAAVTDLLTKTHKLPLGRADLDGIEFVYRTAFFADGPDLNYQLTGQGGGAGRGGNPTYADLMTMEDGAGRQRSYLSSEQAFQYLKDLESKNLIVPVVGDFGGSRALRGVGRYARDSGVTVAAFYLSNVEQYLRQDGKWDAFCANVASMPLDGTSTFIRSVRGGGGGVRRGQPGGIGMFTSLLGEMQGETRACGPARAATGRTARS